MNTRKITIEGTSDSFYYKDWGFKTNIDDIRDFITYYIYKECNVRIKSVNLLSKSMQILVYKDNLKQKTKIVVTFVEVESKAEFNPFFERINTYKVYINEYGFEVVKTALSVLETEINKYVN